MIDNIRNRRLGAAAKHGTIADFKPPQEVATADEQTPETSTAGHIGTPKPPQKRSFKEWLKSLSKKQWIIIGSVAAVAIAGLSVGAYFLFKSDPVPVAVKVPTAQIKPKPEPTPTTVPNTLTGRPVEPAINDLPVTAIMIENSTDARPQSGLHDAGVVFEAVAEGGITRFLTLFQDTAPDYIGPVRSVRPYYIQWALGFDAPIAHAGGSAEALADMTAWHVKDLNHHASYFWRVSNRAAPHNLYTSMAKLHEYEAAKGYGKPSFTGFARKAEKPSTTITARTINFNISSANFNAHYDYDSVNNYYARSEGGKPHTDEKAGLITPKVVVALIMPQSQNGIYSVYGTIGSGKMYVFQDGSVIEGTWHKDSKETNFTFTGPSGTPLALNPGQTWITVLGGAERVSYAP